jgi:hypothetical protein
MNDHQRCVCGHMLSLHNRAGECCACTDDSLRPWCLCMAFQATGQAALRVEAIDGDKEVAGR